MEKKEKTQEPTRNSKKSIIIGIAILFVVMLILLGLTYAYYRTRVIGNNDTTISVVSKLLEITYDDEEATMNMTGLIEPDFEFTKVFYVKNTGDESVTYAVYLEEVINTFVNQDTDPVYFELTCASNINGNTCNGYDGEIFPEENTKLVSNTVEKGEIHTYTLNVNYPETGLDQSDNMGKQLAGKVQIYDETVTVDIEGSIVGANAGDYVEINSKPKRSQIRDGKYKLTAVELGEHTLYIKDKNGNVRGQATLTINKGTQGVSGSTITIDNDSQTATLNITSISTNLGIEITKVGGEFKNPYTEGTLAYAILNHNEVTEPLTIPGQAPSAADEAVLASTEDDYTKTTGNPSYYFRGNVTNNYVNFAGMCWKIVRIEGDGSVKLILEDMYAECNDTETENTLAVYTGKWVEDNQYYTFGYDSDNRPDFINYEGENGMHNSFKTFQTSKLSNVLGKLKIDEWCYDNQSIINEYGEEEFGAYTRIETNKTPSLKCTGTKLTKFKDETDMYVATLTADEIVYAGAIDDGFDEFYHYNYLINTYTKANPLSWNTLSPNWYFEEEGYGAVFILGSRGVYCGGDSSHLRPAVTLKNNVPLSANTTSTQVGTQTNPYVID